MIYSFQILDECELSLKGYPFTVKISRIDDQIARIWLLNHQREWIDVPNNIRLKNLDENTVEAPFKQSFFIVWFSSYSLLDGETEIFTMMNTKQHLISGPKINGYKNDS